MLVFDSWRLWADAEPPLRNRLSPTTVNMLAMAYQFAAEYHGDQTRPAGEPYVEHLLQTLEIAIEVGGATSVPVLSAALLHDVVEDTDCTIDEVRKQFGAETSDLVAWVTKPEPAAGADREEVRRGYLASFVDAPPDVLVVKLADRYSNVQRLDTHPRPVKQANYYAETVTWFVPLTGRAPLFAPYFAEWQRRYVYLAGPSEHEAVRRRH